LIGRKLIKLLKALNPEEFRKMRKIFQSPIYTNNPDHLKCYDALRRYYPKFKPLLLKKEVFFDKMWKGQSFDNWKLRNLFREFTRLTEDYLLLIEQREKVERKRQLTRIYGKRNLYDFFERETKSLLSDLEALPYRDKAYYLQKAVLNEAWYFHPLKDKYNTEDTSFENGMDNIDQYFVYAKLKYGIALASAKKILNISYQLRFLEVIERENKKGFIENNPLLKLFWWSLKLEETLETIEFATYEQLLFSSLPQLRKEDQKLLFFHGLNYVIRQANKGTTSFYLVIFEWHKKGIRYELLLEQGRMDTIHFSNSITYACKVKAYQWAFDFMQNHQQYLATENRVFILNYNLAKWHYYQKEFEQVIPLLLENKVPLAYEFTVRNLMIRVLFELFLKDVSYLELLHNKILNFDKYLRSTQKIPQDRIAPHQHHLRIVYKLSKLLMENQEKNLIRDWLLKELNESIPISGKDWLKEKAGELIIRTSFKK